MIFVGEVRVSTLAVGLVFLALYVARRDKRVLVACCAWLGGFEVAYQLTALAMGTNAYPAASVTYATAGVFFVFVATRHGVLPSPWWLLVVAIVWAAWIGFGFHANQHETPTVFDSRDEALNEAAKTAWAMAYLWPLLRRHGRRSPAIALIPPGG